ncbi:hypothetical protein D3C75_656400 [compost metagenome]
MPKEKLIWRDLLMMAGYEAPIGWSGLKCKKVFNKLETGKCSEVILKELKIRVGAVYQRKWRTE